MRPSSRTLILDAAVRVTERAGITALTMDSAAEEAGLTKGGLLYHFRTREDMILAIQQHLVDGLEDRLVAELGKPWAEATPIERGAAYVHVTMREETRHADLAFMVEAESNPELARIWDELMERWVPTPHSLDPRRLDLFLARLAADGLWMFRATPGNALSEHVEEGLRARVAELLAADSEAPAPETPTSEVPSPEEKRE